VQVAWRALDHPVGVEQNRADLRHHVFPCLPPIA
jgi:hypothetical protein